MKKILSFVSVLAAVATFCCCQQTVEVSQLTVNFKESANPCFAGDEIHFTSTTTGGRQPYNYTWRIGDTELSKHEETVKYSFPKNGNYTVSLTVSDDLGNTATKRKIIIVNPAAIQDKGEMVVSWAVATEGYNSISSPAVDANGNVYGVTRANKIWKFDKNGAKQWEKDLYTPVTSGSLTYGTPSIDSDGTVFIGCGSGAKDAHVLALNGSDGSQKWSFNEWYAKDMSALAPAYQAAIVGIGDNNVYFGCIGTNGIVVSANKANGTRNGFAAPAGGARTGIALTKDGYAGWFAGNYGIAGIQQSVLDNGGKSPVSAKWQLWYNTSELISVKEAPMGGIAVLTVGGKTCFAGVCTDKTDKAPTRVYVVQADGNTDNKGKVIANHRVTDCSSAAVQDQGGVVVTPEGYVVAALAFSMGQEDGGIIIIDPATAEASGQCTVKGRFKVQEKVSGSPAVDNAGNIHFGTESGHYYVVDSNCNLIVKANVADAASNANPAFASMSTAKVWSSVVIGDDGFVYISFSDAADTSNSGIIKFTPKNSAGTAFCQGPANSEWPMYGHDSRHTNRQK